jgi:RHS repeat-associated protein
LRHLERCAYASDYHNRLVEADSVVAGVTMVLATFTYDALDRRIGMKEGSTTTGTLYDGATNDPLMDFVNGATTPNARYLSGPQGNLVDTLLSRQNSNGVAWYLPDRLGTVRDLANNSGTIIDHVDYGAFGKVLAESSPSNGDRYVRFAGMVRDGATGLNLAVYRAQDPATGRWLSQDPVGFGGGDDNLYRYVGNGVTNKIDTFGLTEGIEVPGYGSVHIDGEAIGTKTPHLQYGKGKKQTKIRLPADMADVDDLTNVPGIPRSMIKRLLKNPDTRRKLQNQLTNARGKCGLAGMALTMVLVAPEICQAAEKSGLPGAASAAGDVALDTAAAAGESIAVGGTIMAGASLAGTSVTTSAGVAYAGVAGAATVGGASVFAGGAGFGIGYGIGSITIGDGTIHEHLGNGIYSAGSTIYSGASAAWNWVTNR